MCQVCRCQGPRPRPRNIFIGSGSTFGWRCAVRPCLPSLQRLETAGGRGAWGTSVSRAEVNVGEAGGEAETEGTGASAFCRPVPGGLEPFRTCASERLTNPIPQPPASSALAGLTGGQWASPLEMTKAARAVGSPLRLAKLSLHCEHPHLPPLTETPSPSRASPCTWVRGRAVGAPGSHGAVSQRPTS